jgi:hypothetical protein
MALVAKLDKSLY